MSVCPWAGRNRDSLLTLPLADLSPKRPVTVPSLPTNTERGFEEKKKSALKTNSSNSWLYILCYCGSSCPSRGCVERGPVPVSLCRSRCWLRGVCSEKSRARPWCLGKPSVTKGTPPCPLFGVFMRLGSTPQEPGVLESSPSACGALEPQLPLGAGWARLNAHSLPTRTHCRKLEGRPRALHPGLGCPGTCSCLGQALGGTGSGARAGGPPALVLRGSASLCRTAWA